MKTDSDLRTRILDQEPDAIILVPTAPTIVIVGTYSLIISDGDEYPNKRRGSLQIVPFSDYNNPSGSQVQPLGRIDFDFGIYDIQSHPQYPELIAVATSDAQILFFTMRYRDGSSESCPGIFFMKLGEILIEEPCGSDDQVAIVTQLRFINTRTQQGESTAPSTHNDSWNILLAATTQFGNTKLIKAEIPIWKETGQESGSNFSGKNSTIPSSIQHQIINIHKQAFDLEAWTTLPILYQPSPMSGHLLLLSGGDDGQLLVSHLPFGSSDLLDTDLDSIDVNLLLTLKKEHQAGVVNICDLGPLTLDASPDIHKHEGGTVRNRQQLILTGSYDEFIRLFLLTVDHTSQEFETTPLICSMKLLLELNLGGGVWKIKKLDEYDTPQSLSQNMTSHRSKDESTVIETHYILLIAGHTSGTHIVRLRVTPPVPPETQYNYQFQLEKTSIEGHESLVYAVEAKKANPNINQGSVGLEENGRWEVISTSFYDKKICNWEWFDEKRRFAR